MPNKRTFAPRAEDLLNYAFQTGERTTSRENQVLTNEARDRQAARAQDAAIVAAQMAQRDRENASQFADRRAEMNMRMRANVVDNLSAIQQEKIRGQVAEANRQHSLTEIEMRGNVDARNKAMEDLGPLPDMTEGGIQRIEHALDNQQLVQTATARDRHALQQKFETGDVNAIKAAMAAGRAQLSRGDAAEYSRLEAAIAKAGTDESLHPGQRVATQAQLAQRMKGILGRAQWLPDEKQPKSLQEEAQSRVVTLTTAAGKTYEAYIDPKSGKPIPLDSLITPPKPDPNAPKPPKVLSVEEKKADFRKRYNEAYKAIAATSLDARGQPVPPDPAKVREHMMSMEKMFDEMNPPEAPASPGNTAADEVFGPNVNPTVGVQPTVADLQNDGTRPSGTTNVQQAAAEMGAMGTNPVRRPALPKGTPPEVKVGQRGFKTTNVLTGAGGSKYMVVEIPSPDGKPIEAVYDDKDKKFYPIKQLGDGKFDIDINNEVEVKQYDQQHPPAHAPKGAIYAHSSQPDDAVEYLLNQGKVVFDEHGEVFKRGKVKDGMAR